MKIINSILLLAFISLSFACQQPNAKTSEDRLSFESVSGIKFIEVRREFDTGLAFNDHGFQQEPNWILYFLPGDSVKIYSPYERKYIYYPIYFDHDSVLNFAREWLRIKKVSKDSLVFQLLQVDDKVISKERSNVYMNFYSENYIKNHLHQSSPAFKQIVRKDSLFIRSKAMRANRNPEIIDSAFTARNPVVFQSRVKEVKVNKVEASEYDIDKSITDTYLYPEYNITINKAHKDFSYSFSVLVDDKGIMRFGEIKTVVMPEFEEAKKRVIKGIIEVYLQRFLRVTPGSTLGMPHTSLIVLNVTGKKSES
jgi:hypothetical protein